ncbi:MAG TPA: hypothetical protein DDZ51_00310, partial [Planctomycetaceae bacterium]|nr:hypothetical protein [Planctomycetaceae bacterium]
QVYPEIVRSAPAQFQALMEQRLTTDSSIVRSLTAQLDGGLIQQLSYTHIELLVPLESEQKRSFYQAQCIAGSWSVRQLKRQINSLLYERSQLSTDQQELAKNTAQSNAAVATQSASGEFQIRDPYVFEFLGLRPREVMSESHLENELLDKLQEFLMELGQGFCFEARQRRVLIGDTYYFIDLVFYHRILKCHVLVDLKLDEFTHEHIGQLNTYVSWYDRNVRCETDNPPIGILLCTDRDHALVEYALAGMDNQLFVSPPSNTERFDANYDGGATNERTCGSAQAEIRFHGIQSAAIMDATQLRDFRGALMDTIRTTVQDGHIDVHVAADLPDGTEVEIRIVPASADYKPGDGVQDETPEEIEASIERLMFIEPLSFSPEDQAAWDAGYELEFPAAFRRSRRDGKPRGIVKLRQEIDHD